MPEKSKVLGSVVKPRATGRYVVDPETAQSPLVGEQSVIRACCTGCGKCLELTQIGAERLAKMAKVSPPDVWPAFYFETRRCPLCSHEYAEVLLKSIE